MLRGMETEQQSIGGEHFNSVRSIQPDVHDKIEGNGGGDENPPNNAPDEAARVAEMYQKRPQLFRPGQSGNPSGKPKGTISVATMFHGTLTPEFQTRLESCSKRELIDLILKVNGAIWARAMMTDREAAECARLKLLHLGLEATDIGRAVPALDKWFDRTLGKAPQSIAMTVKDEGLSKVATDKLLRLAAMMDEEENVLPALNEE